MGNTVDTSRPLSRPQKIKPKINKQTTDILLTGYCREILKNKQCPKEIVDIISIPLFFYKSSNFKKCEKKKYCQLQTLPVKIEAYRSQL